MTPTTEQQARLDNLTATFAQVDAPLLLGHLRWLLERKKGLTGAGLENFGNAIGMIGHARQRKENEQ